ncbi:MAG: major facilitator superfamily 1 [Frankiales bacterium]|nr:major facilitator superfamily 1 [Frankiales bacterium]
MESSVRRPRVLLAAVVCGLLLAMLDQTIVGTALPAIVQDLDGSSLYLWAVTAYLVPATVSLPVYARLSDRHGRRAMLLVGMGLFLAGSALSASAQGMGQFTGWRAVQGLGAGALEGLPFILVADLYSGRRSAALQAALAGMMGFAFIAGPLLGGILTDGPGWRWAFLVNLPVGLAAMVVVARFLPRSLGRYEGRDVPVDVAGIALLTTGVGLLLVGLDQRTAAPLLGGVAVIAAFLAVERRAAAPIVPLRLLANRTVAPLLLAGAAATAGLYAGVLLLPRYLEGVRHVSATRSGLLIYPLLLGLVLSTTACGIAMNRWGQWRTPVLLGTALAALGAVGFGTFEARTPDWQNLLFMALIGLGVGPALSGLQVALQRLVEPTAVAGALSTLILVRQVGGAIALAAADTVYAAGAHRAGSSAATATGTGMLVVTLAGAGLAATALLLLPRGSGRLPQPPIALLRASAAQALA